MDFGQLDDILDQDIGYIPTAIKRQQRTRGRPASISTSRQNPTNASSSIKHTNQQQMNTNTDLYKSSDSLLGLMKYSPKNSSNHQQQVGKQPARKNTLFGLHKQTANNSQFTNNSQGPVSFEDFFKTQNTTYLSKPPLPDRKIERKSSFNLLAPQHILEEDLNNSVTSRRGRPPLSRKAPSLIDNQSQMHQNYSENVKAQIKLNQSSADQSVDLQTKLDQSVAISVMNTRQQVSTPKVAFHPAPSSVLTDNSIQQLKTLFSNQLQFQKQSFQTLIKQQRQSHQKQVQKLKEYHQEQIKKRLQIKEFQIQKMKQFYELQLKIYKQRQFQIKQYSSITKKLQVNIQTIQKLQRNIKDNQMKGRSQIQQHKRQSLQRKQSELNHRQAQVQYKLNLLQQQRQQFYLQRNALASSTATQKCRLYELQIQLRNKQSQLQIKHKKLQSKLTQDYEQKNKQLQKFKQQARAQFIQLKEQKNIIQIEKLQVINARKLWDNQRKVNLQELHKQKTKVMQKQIQLASRTGHLQIKQQEIQMNQNDYVNKLKLIQLQKRKMEIQKKTSKGQLYLNSTSSNAVGMKTTHLLGTAVLNRTSQSALNKQFYSKEQYDRQPFQLESNYRKSVTQMRDEFLKSLPKF